MCLSVCPSVIFLNSSLNLRNSCSDCHAVSIAVSQRSLSGLSAVSLQSLSSLSVFSSFSSNHWSLKYCVLFTFENPILDQSYIWPFEAELTESVTKVPNGAVLKNVKLYVLPLAVHMEIFYADWVEGITLKSVLLLHSLHAVFTVRTKCMYMYNVHAE